MDGFDAWMQMMAAASSFPYDVRAKARHQSDVVKVMTVLSGKHRYEQVDAAINAVGCSPETVYMLLSSNEDTAFLQSFYEALGYEHPTLLQSGEH